MAAETGGTLVSAIGFAEGVCLNINGMEDEELLTSTEVTSRPVHEMTHHARFQLRIGIVDLRWRRRLGLDCASGFEPPFDRREGRDRIEQVIVYNLLADCSCSDESNLTMLESATETENDLSSGGGIRLRRTRGPCGAVEKRRPALFFKPREPSEEPDARTWDAF
jgi:hypothetical protein